jgi:hypothetical protein
MSSSTNNQNNIYPKSCNYGCNTQIYWNVATNEYWEVFTRKKHICPTRSTSYNNNKKSSLITEMSSVTTNKPTYYSKKPWSSNQPKPKMSNSFELLTGPIDVIQKKYEILSDIVTEYNGKVHGSQRDRDPKTGLIDLLVYYEVPQGQREEVKRKFENFVKSQVVLQKY